MAQNSNRREFLQTTSAAGIGFWVAGGLMAAENKSPNEKIQFASVGITGKGESDSNDAGQHGDMVAICDVDESKLNAATSRFPKAKKYTDFRKMLDEMGKSIDAVTVSTPDHTHAAAAVMAMRMGKHCFCQKPLTHTLHEARVMGEVAREKKLATQMGNQGTAMSGLRKAAALLRKGALGKVSQVHVWTNRPIWPQGGPRPKKVKWQPGLHWDLWLGPAPYRAYGRGYHPFSWRGFWDFGTGALGDMACHTLNMAFMGLDLRNPTTVQAVSSGHDGDGYPARSIIKFEFPATDWRDALVMVWYDGGNLVAKDLIGGKTPASSGSVIIGEKGKIYSPNDYGAEFEVLGGAQMPAVEFEESPGHFEEWVRAIKGGPAAKSNFPDYAGPLTETILLGNLAVWAASEESKETSVVVDGNDVKLKGKLGDKIVWDAKNQKAKGIPDADYIIRPEYRKGYSL